MTDNEKIQSFGDMVDATERLTKPWRIALIVTNVLWAVVFMAFIIFAYLSPVEMEQQQDYVSQVQTQNYSDGAAKGG